MMQRQLLYRRPLLPAMTNKLPFVLANRTSWVRLRGLAKLRSALYADKVFHRPPNLLPQPPQRTGERIRGQRTAIRGQIRAQEREDFLAKRVVAALVSSAGTRVIRRAPRRAPLQLRAYFSRFRIEPAPVISRSMCGGFPMYST